MSDDNSVDLKSIGLKPYEIRVLQWGIRAYEFVPNGHHLHSGNMGKAAKRMVDRGFLTETEDQITPAFPDWIVVKLTEENIANLRAAEKKYKETV